MQQQKVLSKRIRLQNKNHEPIAKQREDRGSCLSPRRLLRIASGSIRAEQRDPAVLVRAQSDVQLFFGKMGTGFQQAIQEEKLTGRMQILQKRESEPCSHLHCRLVLALLGQRHGI
jgi:hypothetical protein